LIDKILIVLGRLAQSSISDDCFNVNTKCSMRGFRNDIAWKPSFVTILYGIWDCACAQLCI